MYVFVVFVCERNNLLLWYNYGYSKRKNSAWFESVKLQKRDFFIRVYVVWFFWCEFTIFLVCIYSRRSITGISLRLLILQNTLTATTVNKLITNEHEMMMQWLQSSCTYRAWNLTYCCYRTYTVPYYNALLSLLLNLMFFLTIHTNFDFFCFLQME